MTVLRRHTGNILCLDFFKIDATHSEKENLTDGEECEVELTA